MSHSIQVQEALAIDWRLVRHIPHRGPGHFHHIVKGVPLYAALYEADHPLL